MERRRYANEIEAPDYNYKIILVGNKRVGKTSITNRAVFEEFNEQEQSTRVVQISQKLINIENTDKWAQLHIWDTLGQEKFMALAPLFFRRSVGAFLCYDVTSMESFKALDKWYEQICKNTDSKVIVMMLGNKKDKENREVPYNLAAQYAMEHDFGLMEVSAKHGSGIKEAFNRMIAEVYKFQTLELGADDEITVAGGMRKQSVADLRANLSSIILNPNMHYYKEEGGQEPKKKKGCNC